MADPMGGMRDPIHETTISDPEEFKKFLSDPKATNLCSHITIKLSYDATEAMETLAKVRAELEQIIALQEKVGVISAAHKCKYSKCEKMVTDKNCCCVKHDNAYRKAQQRARKAALE